jgi:hypothetical protein
MNISIDRGIPMPTHSMRKRTPVTVVLSALEVGESALMPEDVDLDCIGGYMRSASRGTGKKFARRTMADGVRVWRLV